MTTPDDEPRVRIVLGSEGVAAAPAPLGRQRSPRGPILLMAAILLAAVVGLGRLSDDAAAPAPQPTDGDEAPPEASAEPSSPPAISNELATLIDAYDRITYTSISPELSSIVRGGDEWLTIDDQRNIAHSPNLLSWVPIRELRGERGLALTTTARGPITLTTSNGSVHVIDVDEAVVTQTHPVAQEPLIGAISPDGFWAVVTVEASGSQLTTGGPDGTRQVLELGADVPASIAITSTHVALTVDRDDASTSLVVVSRSALTSKAPQPAEPIVCRIDSGAAELVTSGDARVHLVSGPRSWLASSDGARFDLAVDATGVAEASRVSVRPIATGVGWSILERGANPSDVTVWITRDGGVYEPQRIPSGRGIPGHVIWAYLGGSEGVGVRVSDTAAERGLLRIGDVRSRHPRPQELARNTRIELPPLSIELASPDCPVGVRQDSSTSS